MRRVRGRTADSAVFSESRPVTEKPGAVIQRPPRRIVRAVQQHADDLAGAAFLRLPRSGNHHDLGLFGVGPAGNEFEIMWMLPRADWGDYEDTAGRPARRDVGLAALVQDILGELEPDTKDRAVRWHVEDLPSVRGAPATRSCPYATTGSASIRATPTGCSACSIACTATISTRAPASDWPMSADRRPARRADLGGSCRRARCHVLLLAARAVTQPPDHATAGRHRHAGTGTTATLCVLVQPAWPSASTGHEQVLRRTVRNGWTPVP